MAPLPRMRLEITQKPFTNCATDFAGPFYTMQGRGRPRRKRHLCLSLITNSLLLHFSPWPSQKLSVSIPSVSCSSVVSDVLAPDSKYKSQMRSPLCSQSFLVFVPSCFSCSMATFLLLVTLSDLSTETIVNSPSFLHISFSFRSLCLRARDTNIGASNRCQAKRHVSEKQEFGINMHRHLNYESQSNLNNRSQPCAQFLRKAKEICFFSPFCLKLYEFFLHIAFDCFCQLSGESLR